MGRERDLLNDVDQPKVKVSRARSGRLVKRYPCDMCGMNCTSRKALLRHQQLPHERCSLCKKWFTCLAVHRGYRKARHGTPCINTPTKRR